MLTINKYFSVLYNKMITGDIDDQMINMANAMYCCKAHAVLNDTLYKKNL